MRRLLPILIVLLALAALTRPAAASEPGARAVVDFSYGDTLTLIWKPLPNLPAIARPGDTFTVWANAPSSASGFGAALQRGAQSYPLTAAGGGWQAALGRWVLSYQVPAGVPEELYDLSLTCSTASDLARHAVKVIPAFKTDFYFAQISDTHLPSHAFSSDAGFSTADTSGMPDFTAVIADLNLIHPEFIIHTGDLVNEGELEEYLGMYEMGRALDMLNRLYDPIFVSTGNHDIGGWKATPPPDGTARKNWWRYYGWPYLENPPAGDVHHSQDYSFDYGLLHMIGLEAYINNGSYDSYRQDLWGAQSFTAEQMSWLQADVAAVPAGHAKLAFYHYDFTGSQINPAALGLNGTLWGHVHSIGEGNRSAQPFNLGMQSVIDGKRTFRIFRVSNGVVTPTRMYHSGTTVDSLATAWSGANDGTRTRLTVTVTNRFPETWDHAQIVFAVVDHDSSYSATGGTLRQSIRQGGIVRLYVDVVLPAGGTTVVSVAPDQPLGVGSGTFTSFRLDPPSPNPFVPGNGALTVRYATPVAGPVRIAVYDLEGRRVALLLDRVVNAGEHSFTWDGRGIHGRRSNAGVLFLDLTSASGELRQKIAVTK